MLKLYQTQSCCVIEFCSSSSALTQTQSTQSQRLVYCDSLRLSAFVKATLTICAEDSLTLYTLTHPEGILTDNLLW